MTSVCPKIFMQHVWTIFSEKEITHTCERSVFWNRGKGKFQDIFIQLEVLSFFTRKNTECIDLYYSILTRVQKWTVQIDGTENDFFFHFKKWLWERLQQYVLILHSPYSSYDTSLYSFEALYSLQMCVNFTLLLGIFIWMISSRKFLDNPPIQVWLSDK